MDSDENVFQVFKKEPIDQINDHILKNLKTNIVKRPMLRAKKLQILDKFKKAIERLKKDRYKKLTREEAALIITREAKIFLSKK